MPRRTIDFAAAKVALDVRDVARALDIRLVGGGKGGFCPGPNHGRGKGGPSLRLFPDGFICYGASCGEHGDAFDLVRLAQGGSLGDAAAWLEQQFGRTVGSAPIRQQAKSKISMDVPSGRATVMREIWDAVRHGWSDGADRWLASRGLDPEVAWDAGCRDFGAPLAIYQLREIVARTEPDLLRAAGLMDYAENGEPRLWFPLRMALEGRALPGLCFPVRVPGHAHPVGWRWRFYEPFRLKDGGTIKCADQCRTGYAWATPPLGVGYPDPGTNALDPNDPDGEPLKTRVLPLADADTVILCEGEPDWLSLLEVANRRAAVLGFTGVAKGWVDAWTLLLGGKRVVLMTHEPSRKKMGATLAEHLLLLHGPAFVATNTAVETFDEECDANDMLRHDRGGLRAKVDRALA